MINSVMTWDAIAAGVDYIVVGRPIVVAKDPLLRREKSSPNGFRRKIKPANYRAIYWLPSCPLCYLLSSILNLPSSVFSSSKNHKNGAPDCDPNRPQSLCGSPG
jgi:hypothetical protein